MSRIISKDAIIGAVFSAIGWGIGYILPAQFGCGMLVCIVACYALGLVFEAIGKKVLQSRKIRKMKGGRLLALLGFIAVFFIAELILRRFIGQTLLTTLAEQYIYVIVFPILGFLVSLGVYKIKKKRIEEKYGKGEKGAFFGEDTKEYFESLDGVNGEITGKYDKKYAVKTKTGTFVGIKDGKTVSYRGIPYATAERFRAPVAMPGSDKVYEAKYYGASPVQPAGETNPTGYHRQGEDCLNLNICFNPSSKVEKKAVLVSPLWGFFSAGSTVSPVCDGSSFVEEHPDIIYVSFDVRLGILGFLDLSGIEGGEKYPDSQEAGILDAIEALKWIKSNISAFGGDENNITIFGGGIGGIICTVLAASEKAKGLFKKVFLASNFAGFILDRDTKRAGAKALADSFGCKTADDLAALSLDQIRDYTLNSYVTGPCHGTSTLPEDIFSSFRDGKAADVDITFCQVSDDFGEWIMFLGADDIEEYLDTCLALLKKDGKEEEIEKARQLYNEVNGSEGSQAEAKRFIVENVLFRANTCLLADCQIKAGGKARILYSDYSTEVELFGCNALYMYCGFLGNIKAAEHLGIIMYKSVVKLAMAMLSNYTTKGDPSLGYFEMEGVEELPWPLYDGTAATVLGMTDNELACGVCDFVSNVRKLL